MHIIYIENNLNIYYRHEMVQIYTIFIINVCFTFISFYSFNLKSSLLLPFWYFLSSSLRLRVISYGKTTTIQFNASLEKGIFLVKI